LKDGVTLGVTLVLAIHLMLVSVLATQLFDPKLADLSVPRARLEQSLSRIITKDAPESLKQVSGAIIVDYGDMTPFLESIRTNSGLSEYVKRLADQLKLYAEALKNQPAIFASLSRKPIRSLISSSNNLTSRTTITLGLRQAQGHVDALIGYFEKWLSNWTATAPRNVLTRSAENSHCSSTSRTKSKPP
jgi:hypothetical protein